jgi:hypothetical protein
MSCNSFLYDGPFLTKVVQFDLSCKVGYMNYGEMGYNGLASTHSVIQTSSTKFQRNPLGGSRDEIQSCGLHLTHLL